MVVGAFPQRQTGRGVKLTTHLDLVSRPKMVELYLHSPIRVHDVRLIRRRDNFVFFVCTRDCCLCMVFVFNMYKWPKSFLETTRMYEGVSK
jgi:hypothetical protein